MRVFGRQSRADESRVPGSGNQSTVPAGQYVTHCKVPLHGAIGFVAPQEMLAGRQPSDLAAPRDRKLDAPRLAAPIPQPAG